MKYEPVIGLEVHAELKTKSKIFCSCSASFGGDINTHVCPVCSGMPGSLPVLNKKVVEYAVRMGLATNCDISAVSVMARKNYFYPDLPKAYQISQFDKPLCQNGRVDFEVDGEPKSVRLTRIHIEEDAGKLLHEASADESLIDFNRCGVPLIEMVTEPDIRSSAEAKAFLEHIKTTLSYLDICDCKMEEGSIRCDVNVSVRPEGSREFGTRVEMKNINTFSGAVRAIDYEVSRQTELLFEGGTVEQETRRWDDIKLENYTMRTKEDAQDYRYFPDPDLLPIEVTDEWVESIRESLPELPLSKLRRYIGDYGIPEKDARLIAENKSRADFLDKCEKLGADAKTVTNWLLGDIAKLQNDSGKELEESGLTPAGLCALLELIGSGKISGTAGKKVLGVIFDEGGDPLKIIEKLGLYQMSGQDEIKSIIEAVIKENEKSVADYKKGKQTAFGYLIGQCMKASKGKANPQVVNKLLKEILD
ncbi:MAG: Asp-tRNA(Asn)/Glu-tRNA(Gln) amidotransferase subunit GatB [Bacillota bacterium]|nr:Asp-tRNA(Asn)/Glu-tRNA(Gln) amidotransferase subunit GatB [Bacillota bacterium]